MSLAAVFRAALPTASGGVRSEQAEAALEQDLQGLLEAGRAAWPELALPAAAFIRHLAARSASPPGSAGERPLGSLHAADLYLACACAQGDETAIAAFEERYLSPAAAIAARVDTSASFLDEVRQRVRLRLFVSDGQAPPKITEYRGRGDLLSWVRTVVLRTALNARREGNRTSQGDSDDLAAQVIDIGSDPEAGYLKHRFQQAFRPAFQDALAVLSSEQRNLLRFYFVNGLGIEKLGALFQVAPSTISRRLASARAELGQETRRLLKERLRLSSAELESIAGLLRSQIEISLAGL